MILPAIILGLAGSFHCVGMCGPIAMAAPLGGNSFLVKSAKALSYNGGRVLTYVLLGIIFGFLGEGISLAGWSRGLSITVGAVMLLVLLLPKVIPQVGFQSILFRWVGSLKRMLGPLLKSSKFYTPFIIGFLNGLLPCGLVYMGLAGALATCSISDGAVFMFVFGMSTFPIMLTVTLAGSQLKHSHRLMVKKFAPLAIGLVATLLIIRGLNLGIPYLSPNINNSDIKQVECHK